MSASLIIYPVLCQVLLTFVLLFATGRTRLASLRRGEVSIKQIALGQNAWPARPTQVANTYNSQFQLPILLYGVCIFADINGEVDMVIVYLAWGFVVSRIIHAGVYATTNDIGHRFYSFVAGFAILLVLWLYFAYKIILGGG